MNTSPEFQPYVAQQPQPNQLPHSQIAMAKLEQPINTTQVALASPIGQLDTLTLVQYGGIAVAIILSIAILILALAEYTKVFIPVMLQKRDEKTE
ncbi:MAG TPA: hypothetical protein V6C85_25295 [Allocoleopsis sp.]